MLSSLTADLAALGLDAPSAASVASAAAQFPPAGVTVAEGQHYNPYFPGGAISMGAPLYDEVIEYEDGTPATTSQLAKDVATFLCWTAEPEHDERKQMGLKATVVLSLLTALTFYYKKHTWAALKTRRVVFKK